MTTLTCEAARALVAPYADGELDLGKSLELEAHIAACEDCRQALDAHRALAGAVRQAPYQRMPEALRQRLHAAGQGSAQISTTSPARAPVAPGSRAQRRDWARWSLPVAASVLLALGIDGWRGQARSDDALLEEVVAGHVRSLQVNHLSDVISSDQHTVKPWFAGRLDFAPPVRDLAGQDYPLLGGRLDYLQHRTVAALVYGHRKHLINLFVWPATGEASPRAQVREGYDVVRWRTAGMQFIAVSDLNAAELLQFAGLQAASTPASASPH